MDLEIKWYYSPIYKKYKNYYTGEIITESEYQNNICSHEWESMVLFNSIKVHCKKCGMVRSDEKREEEFS
jgi:hypothetical protein